MKKKKQKHSKNKYFPMQLWSMLNTLILVGEALSG